MKEIFKLKREEGEKLEKESNHEEENTEYHGEVDTVQSKFFRYNWNSNYSESTFWLSKYGTIKSFDFTVKKQEDRNLKKSKFFNPFINSGMFLWTWFDHLWVHDKSKW